MAIKRKQLADLSRKSGKFKYLEIVALDGLQALTKCSPDGDMLAYPKGITRDDLRSHIHYLIDTLNLNDNYELVVTNAPFTFYVGNYVIHQEKIPEPITVFFGEFSSNYLHDSSCFAVNDPFVCQSVSGNIINWILNHPETTRNKQNVVAVLERMLITL
jgi:hypothetical protein